MMVNCELFVAAPADEESPISLNIVSERYQLLDIEDQERYGISTGHGLLYASVQESLNRHVR